MGCNCSWTSSYGGPYACPKSELARSGKALKVAKGSDTDLCFGYCCGVVEEMLAEAEKIILQRDKLAEIVRASEATHEQYLRQELAAKAQSVTPGGSSAGAIVFVIGGVASVFWMMAARRRQRRAPLI